MNSTTGRARRFLTVKSDDIQKIRERFNGINVVEESQEHIQSIAAFFRPPSSLEILQKPRNHLLKYIWFICMLIICLTMAYTIIELALDYIEQNTGTLLSSDHLTLEWLENNFKLSLCMSDQWVDSEELEKLNLTTNEQAYLMGFLIGSFELMSRMNTSEIEQAKPRINQLIKQYGNLDNLFQSLVYKFKFGDIGVESIDYVFNGPDSTYLCIIIPLGRMIHYGALGNFEQKAELTWNVSDNIRQHNFTFHSDPLNFFNEFYLHQYNPKFSIAMASGRRNIIAPEASPMEYSTRFRRYQYLDSAHNSCIPITNEIIPLGYAGDLCAFNCTDKMIFQAKYNCSLAPLLLNQTNMQFEQCNYFNILGSKNQTEYSMLAGHTMLEFAQEEGGKCMSGCSTKRYCEEWWIQTTLNQNPKCHAMDSNICNKTVLRIRGSIDRVRILKEYSLRSWNNVLSDFGGQIGLFVGISLISIVQLILHWCVQFKKLFVISHNERKRSKAILKRRNASLNLIEMKNKAARQK